MFDTNFIIKASDKNEKQKTNKKKKIQKFYKRNRKKKVWFKWNYQQLSCLVPKSPLASGMAKNPLSAIWHAFFVMHGSEAAFCFCSC